MPTPEPLSKIDNRPIGTLYDLTRAMPESELFELDALGDTHDDTRWQVGDKAVKYIDEWNLPAMLVYALIGQRADYSASRVRQMCRVSRFFKELHGGAIRNHYFEQLSYGIFEHAAKVKHPVTCLKYAFDNGLRRPGELKIVFPAVIGDEDEVIPFTGSPLWARPIYRKIDEIQDVEKRQIAQKRFDDFMAFLSELV